MLLLVEGSQEAFNFKPNCETLSESRREIALVYDLVSTKIKEF